jgi:hypothetical protein
VGNQLLVFVAFLRRRKIVPFEKKVAGNSLARGLSFGTLIGGAHLDHGEEKVNTYVREVAT